MMSLVLNAKLRAAIEVEGVAAFPNECCGILVGRDIEERGAKRRIVEELLPGKNVFEADEQYHRFSIDPRLQLEAERRAEARGGMVLGYYHSHPDHPARPSEYDRQHAWPFYSYVIVSVMNGKPAELTSWVLNDETEQFEVQEVVG